MDFIFAASKVYKVARFLSDINFQKRKNALRNLLKEKEKEGFDWARDELELCLLAFDYLSFTKNERKEFQEAIGVSVDELEKIMNRALFLMFNFEDMAHVLIPDKQKALFTNQVACSVQRNLVSQKLTIEEFTERFTFLEVVYYKYEDVKDLIPAFARIHPI
jgi:hypothetical protein